MYSGTIIKPKKFRVYKKGITTYRIEAMIGGRWIEITGKNMHPSKITLFDCKMVVNEDLRIKTVTSKMDGDDAPVHAWIECESYSIGPDFSGPKGSPVFYNPYRVNKFTDRRTREAIEEASKVSINGNFLTYKN
jgi:hypothetical protein